jgi:glycosyltransferase involved in cell wall biosynthesis
MQAQGQDQNAHVVMIGTSPLNRGGISTVVQSYRAAGFLERWHVQYLTTHTEGPKLRKAWYMLRAVLAFTAVLARPPTFVHVHLATRASFWRKLVFVAMSSLRGIPIVLHVHGGHFEGYYESGGLLRRSLIRWALGQAEMLIALTPSWAAMFRAIVPNATVAVIPNPVDIPEVDPAQQREDDSVLFLGRLTHEKGIDVLLDAFAQVVRRRPGCTLLIGAPGDRHAIDAQLQQRGIERNVRMLGWVDGARKDTLFRTAALFTLPSRAEGLPVGMLEAMAHAMPVIVSRIGGVPDALTHGVEGLIVPPGDAAALAQALCELLGDKERCRRMGAAGRARAVAEFDRAAVIARLDQLYARLSAAHAAGRKRVV